MSKLQYPIFISFKGIDALNEEIKRRQQEANAVGLRITLVSTVVYGDRIVVGLDIDTSIIG